MPNTPSIFVLIASYRDKECQWTIKDMFDKAQNPDCIFVGVCWQADPQEDRDCFDIETRPQQVRSVNFLPSESKGLGWARAQAQALWQGEDYVLQIDSHMRFVQDWDKKALTSLAACDSQQPILTVYPPSYTPPDQLDEEASVRVQCVDYFNPSGILFYTAKTLPSGIEATAPIPTACCAGGFIFGPSSWLQALAHDPEIYFNGEEHALAARLWTHGFDLFSPNQTLLYHYYKRDESPKHWSDDPDWHDKHRKTLSRLRQLLMPELVLKHNWADLGPYGLGNERSLAAYEAWSGVDFAAQSIAPFAKTFPYVLTDEIVASLRASKNIQVSEQAVLFIIDREGFLFSPLRGEIYHINTAATWVWCALENGANWDTLVSGLEDLCGQERTAAENSLVSLVAHWHGQGVLAGDEAGDAETNLAPLREQDRTFQEREHTHLPEDIDYHAECFYQMLDSCICVRYGQQQHVEWLMPSLTQFEVSPCDAPDHILAVHSTQGLHSLFCDSIVIHHNVTLSQLIPYLKNVMLERSLGKLDYMMALHAGVVAKKGAVIAFPANSGDGKSTLVAGLVNAGYRYYSDELAPLLRESCKVPPLPLSICVKDTGLDALQELLPELLQLNMSDRDDGKRAVYMPPPIEMIAPREATARISHIIFPRYQAGAKTQLTPINRAEAFKRLLEQCVSMPSPLTKDDAAMLAGWIEQVECYEMLSGSLEASIKAIDSLV